MKTKKILETLALAVCSAGAAIAGPLPLQNASITATYNGSAAGMLGLDSSYAAVPNSNTSTLDPFDINVEFFTSDALFGVDFSTTGALTIIANSTIPVGAYSMRFDFGTSLAHAISGFTLVDGSAIGGLPGLSILDAHTIQLDLSSVTWNGDFATMTAQIDAAAVPEPGSTTMVLAGLASLALVRRARKPRA